MTITQKQIFCIILCVGLALTFPGCANDSSSPTSETHYAQKGPGQPADDTTGSDISSPNHYPPGTIVIAAIGDSITYGRGSTVGGYPPMLEQKLRAAGYNVVVLNEGVPGEISPETEERFLEVIANVDAALLMIGINDIINPRGDYSTIALIERMLDQAIISKTVPVASTVTPASSESDYAWINPRVDGLNYEIEQAVAARSPKAYLADNHAAILANGGDTLYADRIHFTDQGYNVIADEWFRVLTEQKILDHLK